VTVGTKILVRMWLASATIALGTTSLPVSAQRSQQPSSEETSRPGQSDPLRNAAETLNVQRDRAFRAKDLNAIAALYTPDAIFVELLPALQSMQGQAEIKIHFQELFDANASNLDTTVRNVARMGDDTALVTGDYSLVISNKIIAGHFLQVLRHEAGTWKIAQHVFARPESITESEQEGRTD
jgi:uncharacterized protein (TIGR02246 family)